MRNRIAVFLFTTFSASAKRNNITGTDDNLVYIIQFQSHFLALRHKPEGRVFDSLSLEVFMDSIVPAADSASNRNEYQKYFLGGTGGRCLGLTTLPLSCADSLEVWEP
jgi:hypothetical protein